MCRVEIKGVIDDAMAKSQALRDVGVTTECPWLMDLGFGGRRCDGEFAS
jgi:hypothetical protein